MKNPFKKAKKKDERLKLFIYGESGAGKTFLGLQFPSPAVIDLERGTIAYNSLFDFQVLNANNIKEVEEALEFLKTASHDFKTLIIDPISVLWEMLQKKWSELLFKYNKKSKGFKTEFYDFQTKDWQLIKEEWKTLIRQILSLDLNIVCTARIKDKYSFGGDDFMTKVGETFDGEKNSIYHFDTVIKIVSKGESRIAQIIKDRGQRLGPFKTIQNPTVELFANAYPNLATKSEPRRTGEQLKTILANMKELGLANGDLNKLCQKNLKFSIGKELTQVQAEQAIVMLEKMIKDKKVIKKKEKEAKPEEPNKAPVKEKATQITSNSLTSEAIEALEKEQAFKIRNPHHGILLDPENFKKAMGEKPQKKPQETKKYNPPAKWDYIEAEKNCPQCKKTLLFYCNTKKEKSRCSMCGVVWDNEKLNINNKEEK